MKVGELVVMFEVRGGCGCGSGCAGLAAKQSTPSSAGSKYLTVPKRTFGSEVKRHWRDEEGAACERLSASAM